jgi:enterochelin esterase-like enzyme
MNKEVSRLLIILCLLGAAIRSLAQGYTYAPNTTTTLVLPSGNIVFRMPAPTAGSVQLNLGVNSGIVIFPDIPMTKDASGLWSVTVGPNTSRYYEYCFVVDGVSVYDPGNGLIKPHRSFSDSLIQVPGDPLSETQNLPHGKLNTETYYSTVLQTVRNCIVYTPPGYNPNSGTLYPVLFLYQGDGDKPATLVEDGRVNTQFDFMIADGQAIPMIVALIDFHALPPENFQPTNGDILGYFPANETFADQELITDIMPFVKTHYRIRTDSPGVAIAGFSAGAFEALESGVLHLRVFGAIGALSPFPAGGELGNNFYDALTNSTLVNQALKYFYLADGNQDAEAGPGIGALNGSLNADGINHVYDLVDGVHNTYTISRELHNFVTRLFRW